MASCDSTTTASAARVSASISTTRLDNAYGLIRSYYIYDHGQGQPRTPTATGSSTNPNRDRATIRHRQILPDGWELTLEASHISDAELHGGVLPARVRRRQGAGDPALPQETAGQLGVHHARPMAHPRLPDPDRASARHRLPLGRPAAGRSLQLLQRVARRLGAVSPRRPPCYESTTASSTTPKRTRCHLPQPRRATKSTCRSSSPRSTSTSCPSPPAGPATGTAAPDDGSLDRLFGMAGVRAGTQFWKLFENAVSPDLDVNGVRHVVSPEVTAWGSASDRQQPQSHPSTAGIEDIDDFYGTSIALRQRWQTKRGGLGQRRAATASGARSTGSYSISSSTCSATAPRTNCRSADTMRSARKTASPATTSAPTSSTASAIRRRILSDANVDLNDGDLDLFGLSYAVERSPRFSYFLGYRRIHDTDSDLIGARGQLRIQREVPHGGPHLLRHRSEARPTSSTSASSASGRGGTPP